jgi:hypothetical protein
MYSNGGIVCMRAYVVRDCLGLAADCLGLAADCLGLAVDCLGLAADCLGLAAALQCFLLLPHL